MTNNASFNEQPLSYAELDSLSGSELVRLGKKLAKMQKALQPEEQKSIPLKIAVLGTCNTQFFSLALRPFLVAAGILPIFYEGGYDTLSAEVLDPASTLYAFQPDALIAIVTARDVHEYPALLAAPQQIQTLAEKTVHDQIQFWQAFHQHSQATVFLTNYVIPNRHILSGLEANLPSSKDRFLRKLNDLMMEKKPAFVHLLDFDAAAADLGKDSWFDESAWLISKQPFAIQALPAAVKPVARLLAASVGILRKCLVVDLDNTLWGGIIGDDGMDGINLDPNDALGEAFLDFQETVKAYRERGILLAVCSKNEHEIAMEPFLKHPNMRLKADDFAVFKANWDDKPANLRAIAAALNIGLDALVFFDDNPAERLHVMQMLPMVEVIDVPEDPALYSRALLKADCFNWLQLSPEDLSRTESFQAEHKRDEALAAAPDYDSYLRSLEMKAEIGFINPNEIARFSQLVNKTNQFNLRTQRYAESQISDWQKDANMLLIRAQLEDRFSRYGLIAAMILRINRTNQSAFLDTWVMSCRVFRRDLESEMMNWVIDSLKGLGITTLSAEYIPTAKNGLIQSLLPDLGFETKEKTAKGTAFALKIDQYQQRETAFFD